MTRHIDFIILAVFLIAGVIGFALEPGASGTGLALSSPSLDIAWKAVVCACVGLLVTRSYPWSVRPMFALLVGGGFFVMTAAAAHLPFLSHRDVLAVALALLLVMVVADVMWRRRAQRPPSGDVRR